MSRVSLGPGDGRITSSDLSAEGHDRRRTDRVEVTVRIDYATVDEMFSEFTRDMNEGGLFIETEKPRQPGTEVSMQFHLPGSPDVLRALGRVVRVSGGLIGCPSGMALNSMNSLPATKRRSTVSFARSAPGRVREDYVGCLGPTHLAVAPSPRSFSHPICGPSRRLNNVVQNRLVSGSAERLRLPWTLAVRPGLRRPLGSEGSPPAPDVRARRG